MALSKVDVRPGISILAVLRHLNYKPWFAIGEFVDNALQVFSEPSKNVQKTLTVDIQIDATQPARISIKDNAFGYFNRGFSSSFQASIHTSR